MVKKIKNKDFKTFKFIWIIFLISFLLPLFCSTKGYAFTFESLPTDPYAASQPTYFGKIIWTLQAYNNKIYPGYGDYGANSGPINIAPYDPNAGTYSLEFTSNTQEIDNYEVINGKLFATATDWGTNNYAEGLPWSDNHDVDSTHVFGMTTLNGTDLWMAGSFSSNAVAWHSTDGGNTWQTALSLPPLVAGDNMRFYFIGAYQGKIYVAAQVVSGSNNYPYSEVWNGSTWDQGPVLFGWRASTFAGKMVLMGNETTRGLEEFDGTSETSQPGWDQITSYTIDGNYLYTIDTSCNIQRTTDLVNWEQVGIGCDSSSVYPYGLAVLGNYIYDGTTNSGLNRLRFHVSPGDVNGDGHVDSSDLTAFLPNWHSSDVVCDFNSDNTVDVYDLSILLSHYGT